MHAMHSNNVYINDVVKQMIKTGADVNDTKGVSVRMHAVQLRQRPRLCQK